MYVGQFPSKSSEPVTNLRRVAQRVALRKKSDHSPESNEKSKAEQAVVNDSRFPEVDDIVDRLTNDTELADLRDKSR